MSSTSLLEMKHVKKTFGSLEVLKDISIEVNEGEVVAIIGPSGSGKSTFLRCATLLENMDEGTLSYCGESATLNESGAAQYVDKKKLHSIRNDFGLVFQNFNLFPHFSVLKNVIDAPINVQKRDKAEVTAEARELLKKVGLENKEDSYPGQLSGGQQQRVAIARALAMNPKMLFFDEPTSALDPEITAGILKLLRELANEKMTMVIVTHEIDFARNVADRVIFMDGGVIVEEGKPQDVIDNPKSERTKAFLQKIIVAESESFNEAAKKLFISQPSLSTSIHSLEEEIGVQIFRRSQNGIAVTPDGKEFIGYARQVMEQYELLDARYITKSEVKKRFSVSMQHYSFAVNAFVHMVKQYGMDEYEFAVHETKTHEVIEDVKNGKSEIGILYINMCLRKSSMIIILSSINC